MTILLEVYQFHWSFQKMRFWFIFLYCFSVYNFIDFKLFIFISFLLFTLHCFALFLVSYGRNLSGIFFFLRTLPHFWWAFSTINFSVNSDLIVFYKFSYVLFSFSFSVTFLKNIPWDFLFDPRVKVYCLVSCYLSAKQFLV